VAAYSEANTLHLTTLKSLTTKTLGFKDQNLLKLHVTNFFFSNQTHHQKVYKVNYYSYELLAADPHTENKKKTFRIHANKK
jgi:hypothetical protein